MYILVDQTSEAPGFSFAYLGGGGQGVPKNNAPDIERSFRPTRFSDFFLRIIKASWGIC